MEQLATNAQATVLLVLLIILVQHAMSLRIHCTMAHVINAMFQTVLTALRRTTVDCVMQTIQILMEIVCRVKDTFRKLI